MKFNLPKLFYKKWFIDCAVLAILTALFFIVQPSYISSIMNSAIPTGWDGAHHVAMIDNYNNDTSSDLYKWSFQWGGGAPWSLGYNPLYYIATVIVARGFHFTIDLSIRVTLLFTSISVIFFSYFIARKLFQSRLVAVLAGVFALMFLFTNYEIESIAGINLAGTFSIGLYSQSFASFFLLLWLWLYLDAAPFSRRQLLSILPFAATVLSNTHVGLSMFIVYGSISIARFILLSNRTKQFFSHVFYVIASFAICSFWLIPLLATNQFFQTMAQQPINLLSAVEIFLIPATVATFVFLKYSRTNLKHIDLIGIYSSIVITIFIAILPLNLLFPGLPLQPHRLTPTAFILLSILVAAAIVYVYRHFDRRVALIVVAVFLVSWLTIFVRWQNALDYNLDQSDHDLISYLQTKTDGRSVIEYVNVLKPALTNARLISMPLSNVISAEVSHNSNHETEWTIFRESNLNSAFYQPIRNSISEYHEAYGVSCWLCDNDFGQGITGYKVADYYDQSLSSHLARAEYYGVKYVVVHSVEMKNRFLNLHSTDWKIAKVFGDWVVYQYQQEVELVNTLETPPILTFAPLLTKTRPVNSYDWLRLNEEILFHNHEKKQVLALAPTMDIDLAAADLAKFRLAFIAEFHYKDLDKAKKVIDSYLSQANQIIALEDTQNDLYKYIKALNNKNIHILPRTNEVRDDVFQLTQIIYAIFDKAGMYIQGDKLGKISDLSVGNNQINFNYEQVGSEKDNLLIKYNYFPWWHGDSDTTIYMASPTYILVMANKNKHIQLQFTTPPSFVDLQKVSLGASIAVIAIGVINWQKLLSRLPVKRIRRIIKQARKIKIK